MLRRLVLALAVVWALPAAAQSVFPTPSGTVNVPGAVDMCPTAVNTYVPCDAPGALPRRVVVQNPPSNVVSHASVAALGVSLVVKAGPGGLLGFNCTAITGAAAGFCVAYDSATVPGTGSLTGALVRDVCFFDTTAKGCTLSRVPSATPFSSGMVILMTSAATPYTYTTGTDTGFISADFQ